MTKLILAIVGMMGILAFGSGKVLACGGSCGAHADHSTPSAHSPDATHDLNGQVAQQLGLTPDQKAAAKAILKAAEEQAKTVTDHAAKHKIFEAAFAKIRTTVLTDAQRAQLAEIKGQRHNHNTSGSATATS
jgi:hypothetical protein